MTRDEILRAATGCVCEQRQAEYGAPEENFRAVAGLLEAYIKARCGNCGVTIRPEDAAAMMALVKIGRIATGRCKDDNWVDLAGYAAIGGEMQAMQQKRELYVTSRRRNAGAGQKGVSENE